VFDGERLTAALNQRFAGWLDFTLNLHPWVYPPTFLLLFLPFGALPPLVSLVVFLLSGFVALLVAVWRYVGRGPARAVVGFSLVTGISPAYKDWVENGRRNGLSVFACVIVLGPPHWVASLAQGLAIAVATAIVYAAYRRPAPGMLQLAVLLAATMLAAPHAS